MNDFYEGRMIPLKIADMAIINCNKEIEKLQIENARLQAEVERLTKAIEGSSYYFMSIKLNVENAQLRKAGEAMADEIIGCYNAEGYDPADSESLRNWNAAKDGKPSV